MLRAEPLAIVEETINVGAAEAQTPIGALMKLVILAGGLGTRIAEESETKPKPMVEIGGRPLLRHIMKTYAHHGVRNSSFVSVIGDMSSRSSS